MERISESSRKKFPFFQIHSKMQSNARSHGESEANRRLEGRPPSRLQKRAPAALQLDSNSRGSATKNPFAADSGEPAVAAIPLLSPLILGPLQLPESEDNGGEGVQDGSQGSNQGQVLAVPPGGEGWQHPAVAATDASSLFSFFQSQCALVDHHKWG
ncbi:hypothetical protein Ancab_007328 [Ancistrocladus abbreviatus]